MNFEAKKNCKSCLGRGFIIRTYPMGKKQDGRKKDDSKEFAENKTLCHCATEIKEPEPDECVVPKVSKEVKDLLDDPNGVMAIKKPEQVMNYASKAIPNC